MINNSLCVCMHISISFYLSNKSHGDKCYGRKNFKNGLIERETIVGVKVEDRWFMIFI